MYATFCLREGDTTSLICLLVPKYYFYFKLIDLLQIWACLSQSAVTCSEDSTPCILGPNKIIASTLWCNKRISSSRTQCGIFSFQCFYQKNQKIICFIGKKLVAVLNSLFQETKFISYFLWDPYFRKIKNELKALFAVRLF